MRHSFATPTLAQEAFMFQVRHVSVFGRDLLGNHVGHWLLLIARDGLVDEPPFPKSQAGVKPKRTLRGTLCHSQGSQFTSRARRNEGTPRSHCHRDSHTNRSKRRSAQPRDGVLKFIGTEILPARCFPVSVSSNGGNTSFLPPLGRDCGRGAIVAHLDDALPRAETLSKLAC